MANLRLPACRLLIENAPRPGHWNMAVDEALLDSVLQGSLPTLRWYQWAQPTLSLGYFQPSAEVRDEPRWNGLAAVRRLTGGGAILHDREWTYSLVLPADQKFVRHPYDLYDRVHDAIIRWFASRGIVLQQRGVTRHQADEPLLCFLREDSHDIVCNGVKVLGSAQRRRKGALLQHGSLVYEHSRHAPELPGLTELSQPRDWLADIPSLAMSVAQELADTVASGELSAAETDCTERLAAERYHTIDQR